MPIIVSIDPGYRNLGWSRIDTENPEGVACGVHDVGPGLWTNSQLVVLLTEFVGALVCDADYVVCETQDFGRRHSTPRNVGISWLVGTLASTCGAPIRFLPSLRKFTAFGLRCPRGRKNIKNKSVRLARVLLNRVCCDPRNVYTRFASGEHEHISDALCLMFVFLLRDGPPHLRLPPRSRQ